MAPKDSGPRGDIRRDRTRSQTSKNQYQSSQPSNNSPSDVVRSTLRNTHASTSNAQNNPQPLNPQTLHEHTTNEAQLSKDPYYAHTVRQNETRSLQESFYSLGVDIPSDFCQNRISRIYQSPTYTAIPTQASAPTQAYSTHYLAPEITISDTELPADDDYTWAEAREEYLSNGQDVMNLSSDLSGLGGQFPVCPSQTSRYSHSVYQIEAGMRQGS